ncbi:DUF2817 domain-containing protein [candidate division KSB1 bacterium]|nr:DUF2817 domain-containing protein [candidate division KSB1 bacterium]
MRKLALFCILLSLFAPLALFHLNGQTLTPIERSSYGRYSDNADVHRFLSELARDNPFLRVQTIGETAERLPLFVAILSKNGHTPETLDSSKPTVLIFAAQHGDEQSAKEAALEIIRRTAQDDLVFLLDRLNLLIVPLVNPHGATHNLRNNGQDLDLNRDHVKLEAPETRALHALFHRWNPQVTLDVHEKGDDYYLQQIGVVSNLNISQQHQEFSRRRVLPFVQAGLAQAGVTFHEYLIRQRIEFNDASGAAYSSEEANTPVLYRYSTTDINDGRNSFGLFQTLSFIQEGVSSKRLENIRERTERQARTIELFLRCLYEYAPEVLELVRRERQRAETAETVHLRMRYVSDPAQPHLTLKAFADPPPGTAGFLKTDKAAGEPFTWDELELVTPGDRVVVEKTVQDWRPRVESTSSRKPAAAYLVPPGHDELVRTLGDHGIPMLTVVKNGRARVERYRCLEIVPSMLDYEAPSLIKLEAVKTTADVPRGAIVVPATGRFRLLVPLLLEPLSGYGLIRYFRFGLVPAAGEEFAILRIDDFSELLCAPLIPTVMEICE